MSAGSMVELVVARNTIDTSDQIDLVPAYQKCFVLNGSNIKVADFINTRLTHTALATPHKRNDLLTQDQGGGKHAYMLVDTMYGSSTRTLGFAYYDGGATAFDTSNVVTSNGTGSSFTPTAVQPSPLWYDWVVFNDDTTDYGTMPDTAYIGCLYRGRLVLSGNTKSPTQWYMSMVGNPWKFLYDPTNDGPLSAVSFSNTRVGEVGDIITALIPYKDDLLIFGGANSIWMLVGDPLAGGQLAQVTEATGIYGPKSWCIDNNNNLYFLGSDGLYKMPVSANFTPPENISAVVLPNLVSDWALNKALHRVTMTFDPLNYGILISRVDVTSGVNSNYWFDLVTGGFYPESYPAEDAPYSMLYYPALDSNYKSLLIGCKDGYIRKFDVDSKSDNVGSTSEAITSYVGMLEQLAEDDNTFGKLEKVSSVISLDSDAVAWSAYRGKDAESVLSQMQLGDTPFITGSWTGTGKQDWNRVRLRGVWAGLKLGNTIKDKSWTVEKLMADIMPAGKGR